MHRRSFLTAAGATAIVTSFVARSASKDFPKTAKQRAVRIDALGAPGEYNAPPDTALSAQALQDIRLSTLTAVNVTVSGTGSYARDYDTTIRKIAYWHAQIAAHPDHLMLVRKFTDIVAAKRSKRLGLIFGFQDATPLAEDLTRIDMFNQLGVRIFQLTYNRRNLIGDGCLEPGNSGLSTFGHSLLERLNERKLLIDLSHAGERTTRESIERSKTPVAITHTGCATIASLPRNKTDDELKLLADNGGVVGIYLMPFLRTEGQPTAMDLIRHIEHAVRVCGEDHVGIGTDGAISPVTVDDNFRKRFADLVSERVARGVSAPGERIDAYTFLPDLNCPDRFSRIADSLSERGHSEARIEKLLGGNFARLFNTVWG